MYKYSPCFLDFYINIYQRYLVIYQYYINNRVNFRALESLSVVNVCIMMYGLHLIFPLLSDIPCVFDEVYALLPTKWELL